MPERFRGQTRNRMPLKTTKHRLILYGSLLVIALGSSMFLTRNIDFAVYWYGSGSLFRASRPLYGPQSGLGFPMHYRYPPITYPLLWPLSRMPLYWAGFIWTFGAWMAATAAVVLSIRVAELRFSVKAVILASAYTLAYIVLSVRSGNIQPYIISMIVSALALSESRRVLAASLLALAITFKIWPVFFLPWFLRRERREVLLWLMPSLVLLWLAPLVIWSPAQYLDLLGQWYRSEFHTVMTTSEVWYFPGQSLRGVLLRYFTASDPWIKDFPNIHMLSLSPELIVQTWQGVVTGTYLTICVAMLRSDVRSRRVWDGLAFVAFTVLEPFCPKSGMISLGPAVLIAASLYSAGSTTRRRTIPRELFVAASVLSSFAAAAQYKPLLRVLLAWGIDFYAAVLLFFALVLWTRSPGPGHAEFGCDCIPYSLSQGPVQVLLGKESVARCAQNVNRRVSSADLEPPL